jgi:hypothetical protein
VNKPSDPADGAGPDAAGFEQRPSFVKLTKYPRMRSFKWPKELRWMFIRILFDPGAISVPGVLKS